MTYYLSTKCVENAYTVLAKYEINNASILHIFFILKACGYNRLEQLPLSVIADNGIKPATMLSKLFSPEERSPKKYEFISPFSMKKWAAQAPSEPLNKWVKSRIKNNVIGGATTWRTIIDDDASSETFKFKYNYAEKIKELTLKDIKINLLALAIWSQRFTPFDEKLSNIQLTEYFNKVFKVTEEEKDLFFALDFRELQVEYSDYIHDSQHIRTLIGRPKSESDTKWIDSVKKSQSYNLQYFEEEIIMPDYSNNSNPLKVVEPLLSRYRQVILSGPPGTSKSHIANKISCKYNVKKIQFHPSYSYQNFIGGYVVDGTTVNWSDGVLFEFSKLARENVNEDYLLIIDEINRANVGQVFGETIQCLDRNYTTSIKRKNELVEFSLPSNLYIIGTMNTSDRSIGAIDFAIKRRFISIYVPPDASLAEDLCETDFGISVGDLLRKLNSNLFNTLKNRELAIGHALFFDESVLSSSKKKYIWSDNDFELLFNYKILPLIEDYTKGNMSQLNEILGKDLSNRITGSDFIQHLSDLVS
jgi:5-methylcytosine-specific restriction enzyme B